MQWAREPAAIFDPTIAGARPRLMDEVRHRLRLKHYRLRTERTYLYWFHRYFRDVGRGAPARYGRCGSGAVPRWVGAARMGGARTQNRALWAVPPICVQMPMQDLPWMKNAARAKCADRRTARRIVGVF